MMSVLLALTILGALALAAFCAASETGFLSVQRGRVLHMMRAGGSRAKIVWEAISNMGRTTTALLVGNNLASVTYSSASAALSTRLWPDSPMAQTIWGAIAALVILYLGEFLPKLLSTARPLRRVLMLAPVWRVFVFLLGPIGADVQKIIERIFPKAEPKLRMTPEAVLKILEDRKDGVKLSDIESRLIRRLLLLRSRGEFIVPDSLLSALDEVHP